MAFDQPAADQPATDAVGRPQQPVGAAGLQCAGSQRHQSPADQHRDHEPADQHQTGAQERAAPGDRIELAVRDEQQHQRSGAQHQGEGVLPVPPGEEQRVRQDDQHHVGHHEPQRDPFASGHRGAQEEEEHRIGEVRRHRDGEGVQPVDHRVESAPERPDQRRQGTKEPQHTEDDGEAIGDTAPEAPPPRELILVLHGAHSVTLGSERGQLLDAWALVLCHGDQPSCQSPIPVVLLSSPRSEGAVTSTGSLTWTLPQSRPMSESVQLRPMVKFRS